MEQKKQFKWFTIYEYEREQDYLREMHKSGWRFVKVKGFGMYYFEKCEPRDVVYQLDYNQEGLAHKEEYLQMFRDCSWEYIQDYAGYSYFRKEVSADGVAEEIFCDEDSKLQMMDRVLKGRMLPLLVMFCCFLLPQFLYNLLITRNYVVAALMGGILGLYVAVFIICAKKYMDYKNKKK